VAYENYREWKRWESDSFGTCSRAEAIYFSAELATCGLSGLSGARVLEIGFGNGVFAGWARNEGAIYIGIEAISELVLRGSRAGFDVHHSDQCLHDIVASNSLDLVLAFDVFEHFSREDFEQKLHEIRDVLKVGAVLLARVPSGDSPFARGVQHGDLTHRLTLGSSAVRQVAAAIGFEVDQCRAPVFPRVGFGFKSFVRRTIVASARALAYPVLANLFMGGGSPVLSPDLVFVLRRPRSAG
jgi:SAM-dependent methyltransferase